MTMDEFAEITQRAISRDGFEDYLPTAYYPARYHIMALVGLPSDMPPEEPILEWAADSAATNDEEFLVAYKVDGDHFKVIKRIGPYSEARIYSVD